ncbi:MAG: hypothetical protein Kow0049_24200 [Stanieria sp.]|nr:peptidase M48, Ste24p [Stanieria sp. NIES-3757]
MTKLFKKIAIFSSLSAILLSNISIVQAQTANQANNIYQQAQKDLPEDLYVIYRIVDRLARANGIDDNPWRIVVVDEYNINAFATDVNLLAMYTGILDQLAGDASAIACVVGHEMAHHLKRHIAMSPVQEVEIKKRIQQEAEQEVMAELQDAESDVTNAAVGEAVVRTGGGLLGGLGNVFGNIGGNVLANERNQRAKTAEERIKEIVALKEQELNDSIAENSRTHEFEADQAGYMYIAKAGFEPEGCLRVMEVLGRTPGAEFDSTHPAIPKRIEQLKQLITQYPASTLAAEGKAKISASQPLTYDLSKDGTSLRINSRRGGNTSSNINDMFGQ